MVLSFRLLLVFSLVLVLCQCQDLGTSPLDVNYLLSRSELPIALPNRLLFPLELDIDPTIGVCLKWRQYREIRQ